MSNYKQSSVEWFGKESWKLRVELEDEKISLGEYANKYYQLKQQAKAMHKEEVLSFNTLLDKHEMEALNNNTILLTKEEFYNETFGE